MKHQQEIRIILPLQLIKFGLLQVPRGFEYPQSFNKLFKAKTQASPLAFRKLFN